MFGWNFKWIGTDNDNVIYDEKGYWGITTTDELGNKSLIGEIFKRQNSQYQGITNYIGIGSLEKYSSKVRQLGGKVMMSETLVPGIGSYSIYSDIEGNVFAIWQIDSNTN